MMKQILKSLLCMVLALCTVLSLAACSGGKTTVEEATYPGQDDMTFEQLLELDRQNPMITWSPATWRIWPLCCRSGLPLFTR